MTLPAFAVLLHNFTLPYTLTINLLPPLTLKVHNMTDPQANTLMTVMIIFFMSVGCSNENGRFPAPTQPSTIASFNPMNLASWDSKAPWLDPLSFHSLTAYRITADTMDHDLMESARFLVGEQELFNYLKKQCATDILIGTGYLHPPSYSFTINTNGSVGSVYVANSSGNDSIDSMVIATLQNMAPWIPAKDERGDFIAQSFKLHIQQGGC